MKKILKVSSAVVLAASALALASCDEEAPVETTPPVVVPSNPDVTPTPTPEPEKVVLASPIVEAEHEELFYWNLIEGAKGYNIYIDGVKTDIGNPKVEDRYYRETANGEALDISYRCEYLLDYSKLAEGVHEITFSAYSGNSESAVSNSIEVIKETEKLQAPLIVSMNNEIIVRSLAESFEFDFGDGIVATYTSYNYQPENIFILTPEMLTFPEGVALESGKIYDVKVKAKTATKSSDYSNVVSYSYEARKAHTTPVILGKHVFDFGNEHGDEIEFFDAEIVNVKINGKLFTGLDCDGIYDTFELVNLAFEQLDSYEEYIAFMKDMFAGNFKLQVQACADLENDSSEWTEEIAYTFENTEELVTDYNVSFYKQSGTIVVRSQMVDFGIKINLLIGDKTLEPIESQYGVAKFDVSSLTDITKEDFFVNVKITGKAFGNDVDFTSLDTLIPSYSYEEKAERFVNSIVNVDELNGRVEINRISSNGMKYEDFNYTVKLNGTEIKEIQRGYDYYYDLVRFGQYKFGENALEVIATPKNPAWGDFEVKLTGIIQLDKNKEQLLEERTTLSYDAYNDWLDFEIPQESTNLEFQKGVVVLGDKEYDIKNSEIRRIFVDGLADFKLGENTFELKATYLYYGIEMEINKKETVTIDSNDLSALTADFNAYDMDDVLYLETPTETELTYKVTNNGEELTPNQYGEYRNYKTFGMNHVMVVVSGEAYGETIEKVVYDEMFFLYNKVENLEVNHYNLSWDAITGFDAKYLVEIYEGEALKASKTFDTNSIELNEEFENLPAEFTARVTVVAGDKKADVYTEMAVKNNLEAPTVEVKNGKIVITTKNEGENFQYLLEDKDGNEIYSNTANSSTTIFKGILRGKNSVTIKVYTYGSGNTLNSKTVEYDLRFVGDLTYKLNNNVLKVTTPNVKDLAFECDGFDVTKFYNAETNELDVLGIADKYSNYQIYIHDDEKLEAGKINAVFNSVILEYEREVSPRIIDAENVVKVNDYSETLKYEFTILKGEEVVKEVTAYDHTTGVDLSQFEAGTYTVKVRAVGHGTLLSSYWAVATVVIPAAPAA